MDERGEAAALVWLLRGAVRTYAARVGAATAAAGFVDLPPPGFWAIAALGEQEQTGAALARRMQISKQAVSQLLLQLGRLGYIERRGDPGDRRRSMLGLTPRGRAAAAVIGAACAAVQASASARLGAGAIDGLRRALEAFAPDPDAAPHPR